MSSAKKPPSPKKPRKRRAKIEPRSRGLEAREVAEGELPESIETLSASIARDGGQVLASYREPLGGRHVVLASLPIDKVSPTPYQRDLSEAHTKRLSAVMDKLGRFLDPLIVVQGESGYMTPNGSHRLAAMQRLGARAVVALVVPEPEIAFQILALNTEKAHNLRDKSLEVVRMYRALVPTGKHEPELALELEEPALITLGLCYEERPRFSAGAYFALVRRIEAFLDQRLAQALPIRQKRATLVLALDDLIIEIVDKLKERGLKSPYLKPFVVARCNPLRFRRDATMEFGEAIAQAERAAKKFDPSKIRPQDLAASGGPPEPSS